MSVTVEEWCLSKEEPTFFYTLPQSWLNSFSIKFCHRPLKFQHSHYYRWEKISTVFSRRTWCKLAPPRQYLMNEPPRWGSHVRFLPKSAPTLEITHENTLHRLCAAAKILTAKQTSKTANTPRSAFQRCTKTAGARQQHRVRAVTTKGIARQVR